VSQAAPSKHSLEAFLTLLRAVDAALEGPAEVTVIGGTAVSFIDPTHATTDIDFFVGSPAAWATFSKAYEKGKGSNRAQQSQFRTQLSRTCPTASRTGWSCGSSPSRS
jgi:hypothetical protein